MIEFFFFLRGSFFLGLALAADADAVLLLVSVIVDDDVTAAGLASSAAGAVVVDVVASPADDEAPLSMFSSSAMARIVFLNWQSQKVMMDECVERILIFYSHVDGCM